LDSGPYDASAPPLLLFKLEVVSVLNNITLLRIERARNEFRL
jgi:hypothetical protein